jgi:hypothetical protein
MMCFTPPHRTHRAILRAHHLKGNQCRSAPSHFLVDASLIRRWCIWEDPASGDETSIEWLADCATRAQYYCEATFVGSGKLGAR